MSGSRGQLVRHWRALLAATRDARLSRADCAVLGAVIDRFDDDGTSFPGASQIAKDAAVQRRKVFEALQRLTELGYLERDSGRPGRSNRYRLGSVQSDTTSSVRSDPTLVSERTPSVVSDRAPELASIEPAPEKYPAADAASPAEPAPQASRRKRARKQSQTFAEWRDGFSNEAELIPRADPLFAYAAKVGIPEPMIELAWYVFEQRMVESGKRQPDWPATFRNYVRRGWLRLWYLREGKFCLTTEGEQAAREHDLEFPEHPPRHRLSAVEQVEQAIAERDRNRARAARVIDL